MIKRFFNWLANPAGGRVKALDLSVVSKPIGQQLVNGKSRAEQIDAYERNEPGAPNPYIVLPTEPFRNFSAEHRAHVERYTPDGNLKPEHGGEVTKIKWHVGIAVKGSGDIKKDIADARERFEETAWPTIDETDMTDEELEDHIEDLKMAEAKEAAARSTGLDSHISKRMSEIEAKHELRRAERIKRRRDLAEQTKQLAKAQAEQSKKLAEAQAEALELEEIAMLAVTEVDTRYSRF